MFVFLTLSLVSGTVWTLSLKRVILSIALVMALVGKHFKRGQGVAMGFASTGGGIGAFAFPFFMAAIADRFGIQRGFFFYVALDVLMVALTCAVIWQTRILSQAVADKQESRSS